MTSVLLTTDVVGGVWDFSCTLAAQLTQRGHQVTLLALGQPTGEHRRAAGAAGAELLSANLRLEWMQGSSEDVLAAERVVRQVVEKRAPDLLHANQFAAVASNLGVPVVLTLHSDVLSWRRWVLGEARPTDAPGLPHYFDLVRGALASASAVTSVSGFLAEEVRDLYGSYAPTQVIHNGWTRDDTQPSGLPLKQRTPSTLVAGRLWDPAKNLGLVAEAVSGWNPGRVRVAGSAEHPEGAPALALDTSALELLGFVPRPQLDRLLDESTIYISPALYDPFGLLPLQAALGGCALLLSNIPSYREIWDGSALFFDPHDPADLRRAWRTLLQDEAMASSLSLAAAERARRQFTAERMAESYADLYARLLQTKKPRGAVDQSQRPVLVESAAR